MKILFGGRSNSDAPPLYLSQMEVFVCPRIPKVGERNGVVTKTMKKIKINYNDFICNRAYKYRIVENSNLDELVKKFGTEMILQNGC